MVLAIDVSNYTDPLSSGACGGLHAAGVRHVIVQAIDPPPGYPRGRTREQVQACLDAGLTVDAYIWLWFDLDVTDIQRKLALLDGLPVRQVWLDVEDTASVKYDQATCERKVSAALAACDAYAATSGARTGLYTGRWFWVDSRYMGNTRSYADRELWDANYDGVADAAAGFVAYGGWSNVAIKQYRGTSVLAGIGGLDINVLSATKEAEIFAPRPANAVPAIPAADEASAAPAAETPAAETPAAEAPAPIPEIPTSDSPTPTPTYDDTSAAPSPTAEPPAALDDGQPRETPSDFPWPTWRNAAINYKAIADELGKQLAAVPAPQLGRQTPDDWPWDTWEVAAVNYKGIADELGRELAELHQTLERTSA